MVFEFQPEMQNRLQESSDLLKKVTNFGIEVWGIRLNKYQNGTFDLPANLLFRQVLEANDGIHELLRLGCINISKTILRTCIDCYLQFSFILEGDKEQKAKHFLYHYNRSKFHDIERLLNPNKDNSVAKKIENDRSFNKVSLTPEELEKARITYSRLKDILSSEENYVTAMEYGEKKRKNWYSYFIRSTTIEGLASSLKQDALYEFLFKYLSSFVHSEDVVHSNLIFVEEEIVLFKQLRDTTDISLVTNFSLILLERSIILFIREKLDSDTEMLMNFKVIMDEIKTFREKYRIN